MLKTQQYAYHEFGLLLFKNRLFGSLGLEKSHLFSKHLDHVHVEFLAILSVLLFAQDFLLAVLLPQKFIVLFFYSIQIS
jgi:hypothetical protein